MRRLALVSIALCLACSLHASVSTSTATSPSPLKKQALAEGREFRTAVQNRYEKATRDKAPLTASPADGKSFVNEFVGAVPEDTQISEETSTSGENPPICQIKARHHGP